MSDDYIDLEKNMNYTNQSQNKTKLVATNCCIITFTCSVCIFLIILFSILFSHIWK